MATKTTNDAIQKIRSLRKPLPEGTLVMCASWLKGRITGMTTDGKYIIELDSPVKFNSIGVNVKIVAFEPCRVKEIK